MKSPIFINAQQVAGLIGKCLRSAQRLLAKIRKAVNRLPYRPVTVQEFCTYTGAPVEIVLRYLRGE